MMNAPSQLTLDPSALTAFSASLAALPLEEVRKAKRLFVRNAIADARAAIHSFRGILIVMGVLSIIPVFLIVFIPTFIGYKSNRRSLVEKLTNVVEIWGDDLGEECPRLLDEIAAL